MTTRIVVACTLIVTMLAGSCTQRDKSGKKLTTPTSGTLKIAVDESLKPLLDTEVATFQKLYTNAHVEVIYTSEADAVLQLLKDSVKLVVITRKLMEPEVASLASEVIKPHQVAVAKEGIGIIVNKANRDSVLTIAQISDMLRGNITQWNQVSKGSKSGAIEIVFDQPTSGILRHLKDSLKIDSIPSNVFAVNGNAAVIDHVASKPNALGLIGVTWISDKDDSTTNVFLNTIRVAGIAAEKGGEAFQPFQAYIAQKQYPLSRDIVMISRETYTGLASGFIAFVAGEKGQRIVLKAGLVPTTMPVRVVEISRQPLF